MMRDSGSPPVPPTPPSGAPQPPAPPQPPKPPPGAGRKPPRSTPGIFGRLNALTLAVIGVAAVLVITLVVTGALLVPRLIGGGGGGGESPFRIADIDERPGTAWRAPYDLGDSRLDWSSPQVSALDDSTVLVHQIPSSWGELSEELESGDWYEGVEGDYEAGWETWEEWDDDGRPSTWGTIPSEYQWYSQDAVSSDQGFELGWDDHHNGAGFGSSLPSEPSAPDAGFPVMALDIDSGEPKWEIDLTEVLADFEVSADPHSYYPFPFLHVRTVGGSAVLSWQEEGADEDDAGLVTHLAVVDGSDGALQEQTSLDGHRSVHAFEDGILLAQAADGTESLSAMEHRSLGSIDEVQWESDLRLSRTSPNAAALTIEPDGGRLGPYAVVNGTEREGDGAEGHFISLRDGSGIEGLANRGDRERYVVADGELLEIRARGDGYEIQGLDEDLRPAWDRPVEVAAVLQASDRLLVAGGSRSDDQHTDVMLLDASTGEEQWDQPARAEVTHIHAASEDDRIIGLNSSTDEVTLLDSDGEVIFSERLEGSPHGVWVGEEFLYVDVYGELAAYGWEDGRSEWWYDYRTDSESIHQVGDRLLLVDDEAGDISLLQ